MTGRPSVFLQLGQHLGTNRRRAAGEQSHVAPSPGGRLELGPVEKAVIKRGDRHEDRSLSHELQGMTGMERVVHEHAASGQEAQMRRERKPVDVKQGQDVDQHVVGSEPPALSQCAQAGGDVGVRMHDPLGPSRRARAVQHQARAIAADGRLGEAVLM